MKFYFEQHEPRSESDRYAICKQFSYHLGTPLDAETIWQEVMAVHPGIDPNERSFLDTCIARCSTSSLRQAAQHDVMVVSERQGIVGMVDRLLPDGTFCVVRATGALPAGIYATDRLRIAAYALCLKEMTGKDVISGCVEYIPEGVARFHAVQPRDKRQLLTTLRTVRSIRDGAVPHHPLNAPCNRCRHKERCESRGHRLSELL
jgi:CRISPR-associated exonuclease Cas4